MKDFDFKNIATKKDLVDLEQRIDKKIDEKMDQRFSHHFGLMMEYFEDKFKLLLEGYADIPTNVMVLRDKAQINEEDHVEFRAKFRGLGAE